MQYEVFDALLERYPHLPHYAIRFLWICRRAISEDAKLHEIVMTTTEEHLLVTLDSVIDHTWQMLGREIRWEE